MNEMAAATWRWRWAALMTGIQAQGCRVRAHHGLDGGLEGLVGLLRDQALQHLCATDHRFILCKGLKSLNRLHRQKGQQRQNGLEADAAGAIGMPETHLRVGLDEGVPEDVRRQRLEEHVLEPAECAHAAVQHLCLQRPVSAQGHTTHCLHCVGTSARPCHSGMDDPGWVLANLHDNAR